MQTAVKKVFVLEGLCCGNCAAKIEREVSGLNGVSGANVDVMSKTLSMEMNGAKDAKTLAGLVDAIVKRHDPDIVIKEKEVSQPGKKEIYLIGLDCANCAAKIEGEIRKIEGVKTATVDFVSQKLTLEVWDSKNLPAISREAGRIATRIEPDVKISYTKNEEENKTEGSLKEKFFWIFMITGTLIFAAAMIFPITYWVRFGMFLASYILIGGEVVLKAGKNILKGQVFDENFLMSIATISAFAIGEFPEGVAVMLFYQVGEIFQRLAVDRSRRSIASLMDIRPDFANLKVGDEERRVAPEEVGCGDIILVKPGERIPLDGKVLEGRSSLDTSALTGEPLPRDVSPGDEVLSGSINQNGLLTIEVTKEFGESTLSKILDLVQNASSKKAPTENFITRFSRYYTPVVVFAALALAVIPPLFIPGATWPDFINRALVFLMVSCPCALVISIPLGFFGGIGGASRNGILIKGSNYLEALNRVDTIVFDKTGTLTKGVFHVSKITAIPPRSEADIIALAAHAEAYSSHPIAVSIQKAYGMEIDKKRIAGYEEVPGKGVRVSIDGKAVLAGNEALLTSEGIACEKAEGLGTVVYLAVDGAFAGSIMISDVVKPDSKQALAELKKMGIRRTAMLTGDSKTAGEKIAKDLGIDIAYTGLLPHQKVEKLEELDASKDSNGKLVFVGDGINDAPVLARSDIGIAMGGTGTDAAIEAADIVLMTDEPIKLVKAIRIAKRTHNIVWQNIVFALAVKAVILVLGALGIATMWEAVFGDVGVAILAILNATRAIRIVE